MLKRLLASALFAGVVAGLVAAALQFLFIQPVLLQAELYESGDLTHFGSVVTDAHDHSTHEHGAEATEASPLQRNALTVLFLSLIYSGYALVLVAGFGLAERLERGPNGARQGLLWGLAGFVAVQLAPAAGLPPELPGSAAADISARQLWWAVTIAATGAGLALLAFGRSLPALLLAALVILAPHLAGAPYPDAFTGTAPPELAGTFAARTLAVGLAAWAALGSVAAYFWNRLDEETP